MQEVLLQGRNLIKSFKGNEEPILNHVDLDVYEGDFTVIMGASGAGKSTLLYVLSGMERLTEGQVFYRGKEIGGLNEKQMAQLRKKEFGFVFQQGHLVSNLTLYENVLTAGYLSREYSSRQVQERTSRLFTQMNLERAKDRLPAQVSGGEAQRAAIARAVIHEPGVLFADEPTGALNKKNTNEVLELLTGLNEAGQSILMVTHDLRAAARGTRLLYLEDGVVMDEMTMPRFKQEAAREREADVNTWLASQGW